MLTGVVLIGAMLLAFSVAPSKTLAQDSEQDLSQMDKEELIEMAEDLQERVDTYEQRLERKDERVERKDEEIKDIRERIEDLKDRKSVV